MPITRRELLAGVAAVALWAAMGLFPSGYPDGLTLSFDEFFKDFFDPRFGGLLPRRTLARPQQLEQGIRAGVVARRAVDPPSAATYIVPPGAGTMARISGRLRQ